MNAIQVGDKVRVENTTWADKKVTYTVTEDCHPAVGVKHPKTGKVIYVDKCKCKAVKK